jgi:hypothetical protein
VNNIFHAILLAEKKGMFPGFVEAYTKRYALDPIELSKKVDCILMTLEWCKHMIDCKPTSETGHRQSGVKIISGWTNTIRHENPKSFGSCKVRQ